MTSIDSSSQRDARLHRVVGEIAFQTNILALNAAIEAADAARPAPGLAAGPAADTAALIAQLVARPGAGGASHNVVVRESGD